MPTDAHSAHHIMWTLWHWLLAVVLTQATLAIHTTLRPYYVWWTWLCFCWTWGSHKNCPV